MDWWLFSWLVIIKRENYWNNLFLFEGWVCNKSMQIADIHWYVLRQSFVNYWQIFNNWYVIEKDNPLLWASVILFQDFFTFKTNFDSNRQSLDN